MKGWPVGMSNVLKCVTLSGSSRSTEGNDRPSIPVFRMAGAEKAVKSIQPIGRKRHIVEVVVIHLNRVDGSCRRSAAIATMLRITQALLNRTCSFGDNSSMIPPQLQDR